MYKHMENTVTMSSAIQLVTNIHDIVRISNSKNYNVNLEF